MPYDELLDQINVGLQEYTRDALTFPVAEELLPLFRPEQFEFTRTGVQPPGALYISQDERIFLQCANAVTNQRLVVQARVLLPSGRIILLSQIFDIDATRTLNSFFLPVVNGMLLSLAMQAEDSSTGPGSCYVTVWLVTGDPSLVLPTALIAQGYVTNAFLVVFPNGQQYLPGDGPGTPRTIVGTNPAAGAEVSETVPTGALWRVQAVRATLVTDATVATRRADLIFDDGTEILLQTEPELTQTASQTITYNGTSAPMLSTVSNTLLTWSMPDNFRLPAGYRIRTSTNNLQAGDNWSAPRLFVIEWVSP